MKMHEVLWSAAACCRLRSSQLAGRGGVYRSWESEPASKLAGFKAAASCRTPERLRRLTPMFSVAASSIFTAAKNLLSQEDLGHKQMLRFAQHDSPFGCGRWPRREKNRGSAARCVERLQPFRTPGLALKL